MGRQMPEGSVQWLGMALGAFLVALLLYGFVSYTIYSIAKKTKTESAWLAFVPVANLYLLSQAGGQSLLVFLLCFIPGVNIVGIVLIGLGLARARRKPDWVGILFAVPVVNMGVLGYLAFAD